MSSVAVGRSTLGPAVQGKVEYCGSVSIDLPDNVTARIVGNAVVLNGTYHGVLRFLGRCAGLQFQLILDDARKRLGWP